MRALFLFLILSPLLALFTAPNSLAQNIDLGGQTCVLADAADLTPQQAYAERASYDCSDDALKQSATHLWLIVDLNGKASAFDDPALLTRVSYHGALTFLPIYEHASAAAFTLSPKEIAERSSVPSILITPLPRVNGEVPTKVLIGVETPWDTTNWTDIELVSEATAQSKHISDAVMYALLVGLLMTPIVLNIFLFPVLRYKFMPYHLGVMVSALVYGLSWAGFLQVLPFTIEPIARSTINHISVPMAFAFAALLTRELCGREALNVFWWRALPIAGLIPLITSIIIMLIAPNFSHYGSMVHHLAFIIPLSAILGSLLYGSVRGIKICQMQLLAWAPMLFYIIGRIARGTGLIDDTSILDMGLYPSLATEGLLTTSIVGYRIYTLRKERDLALQRETILTDLANVDALTGALNRRAFIEGFNQITAAGNLRNRTISLLTLDLDHFKDVNDAHGHAVGDEVLKGITHILKSQCRGEDLCARFGGEEFSILLITASAAAADGCANRLRSAIENHMFPQVGRVTASIGVVQIDAEAPVPFESWYSAADKALYAAKAKGRNRVQRSGWAPDYASQADQAYAAGWQVKDA